MSIQDNYLDIQNALKKANLPDAKYIQKTFEAFAEWAFELEETRDKIASELQEAYTTIRTMMKVACPEIKIAYKLLRQRKDGSLGSLFINRKEHLPVGMWMRAEEHRTNGFYFRPGWHALLKPVAPHLKTNPKNEKRIWAMVAVTEFDVCVRPETQGGKWLLAQNMMILKTI